MKDGNIFKQVVGSSDADAVFSYFMANLKKTIKTFDYFVDWSKVIKNYRKAEISLNLLNVLVGKDDIEAEALNLLRQYPDVIHIIPALLAVRDEKIGVNAVAEGTEYVKQFDFAYASPEDGVLFLKETGFLKQLSDRNLKSIPDYFIGAEAGLDSNGRKNRTGKAMESLTEYFIRDICARNDFEYIAQATQDSVKEKWGKNITIYKKGKKETRKRADFAINTLDKLFLIETNFYNVGGSKLKSTAGEYIEAYHQYANDGHQFIWITDGLGWKKAVNPLRDSFNVIDYILNIDFVQKGVLEKLLKQRN